MSEPTGRYVVVHDSHMRKRAAAKADPRWIFYEAGLRCETYEDFLLEAGDIVVSPPTHPSGRVSGRQEIKWWRRQGWIRDA